MCKLNNETQTNQVEKDSFEVPDVLLIVVSTIGVLLNGLLVAFGRPSLPKSCAVFICNLAVADLGTVLIAVLWGFRRMISSSRFLSIASSLSWVTVSVSFSTLLAIAVQRYMAVVHSLWSFSEMKNHTRLFKRVSISTWLFFVILGVVHNYHRAATSFPLVIIFELIITVVVFLYFQVYMFVRNYRIRNGQGIFANQTGLLLKMKKEAKLSVVVFCVTALLIVAVLPYIIILQLKVSLFLFGDSQSLLCNRTLSVFDSYWVAMEMLAFSLNPIIYAWRFRITNRQARRVIPRRKTGAGSIGQQQTVGTSNFTELAV